MLDVQDENILKRVCIAVVQLYRTRGTLPFADIPSTIFNLLLTPPLMAKLGNILEDLDS